MSTEALQGRAAAMRARIIEVSHARKIPHLASSLSCVDILTCLYEEILNVTPDSAGASDRDRFILSKGHAASALYTALSMQGFIADALLDSHGEPDSPLEEHPSVGCVPGVEASTGSLGHGLSIGSGLALGGRIRSLNFWTCVLLSDGECNEGSTWEAAQFSAAQKLNLTVVIDFNKWQATGRSQEVLALDPLVDKWRASGWHALEGDGHDMQWLQSTLAQAREAKKPTALIAHTVKGKGVSFMEDDNNWHYRTPTSEEVSQAKVELGVV